MFDFVYRRSIQGTTKLPVQVRSAGYYKTWVDWHDLIRVKNFLEKGLFIPADRQALPYIKINSPEAFLTDMLALILHLQTPGHHNLAVAKLEYMLLLLQHQESNNSFCGFHRPALQQLVHDIVLTPEQDWDFTAAAQNMNISLKHFRRIFLKFSGMSPVHFVLRQRILKACGMLVSSLDPIKSIANECGFKNEFYFSRIFKKYMKVSPENYRIKQPFTSGTFKNH